MQFTVLTLFPDYFASPWASSLIHKAQQKQLISCQAITIREYALGAHQLTDDRPFGGGPGMVMMVEPIDRALRAVLHESKPGQTAPSAPLKRKVVLMSAKGTMFTQQKAREYAALDQLILICGHYEGVDERVAEHLVDEEVCIGPYVLTGGEPAAAAIIDSVARLVPGVLGNELSNQGESHDTPGQMGFPQYTQPREYQGWSVPEVLVSGDHAKIAQWRNQMRQQSAVLDD